MKCDEHGYFSDNAFIEKGPKNITYHSQNGIKVECFLANLKDYFIVRRCFKSSSSRPTLSDTYYNWDDQKACDGYIDDTNYSNM